MNEKSILRAYNEAKERYQSLGVDVEKAMSKADDIAVSMHCWQGDDVIGFDSGGGLTGGIATTGNYPGRARNAAELRADIDKALTFIPGRIKLNIHASYAEKGDRKIDRDQYDASLFTGWADWAKAGKLGLDFNPTYFSHPMMDGDFSLASRDEKKRRFWVEHGKRCREIGLELAKATGEPCVVNFWMPDGYKDVPADTAALRGLMTRSLDEIFKEDIDENLAPCAIESKLFGVGVESYTVASHEYSLLYAQTRGLLYCLDAGHFHPTEVISAKISAVLEFLDRALLHVSRGIRWDSDHVITYDDELTRIMDEVIWNGYENRVFIGLDYFDASINRIACWVIGMRNSRRALLNAALAPIAPIREAEIQGDYTRRLALLEERKALPLNAVWDYYCMERGVPVGQEWLNGVLEYERSVLLRRD